MESSRGKLLPGLIGYAIAIIVGLVLVCLYAALGVYLVVPFREVRRVMFRR